MIYNEGFLGRTKETPACWHRRLRWISSLGGEDPLEKERTTHSSILAWEIPWTEEPGRLQCMVLQRVGGDGSDLAHTQILYIYI